MPPPISLRARMLRLSRPIFIETLLMMLIGIVDVIMLSAISDACVAAVGLVNQVLNMIFLIFVVGAMGTSVVCSQYIGAGQETNFTETVGVSLLLNTAIGILVSFILHMQTDPILALMNASPDILGDARRYLRIVGSWAFLPALMLTAGSVLRSRDMANYPMYVSLVGNVVNFLGNYMLIQGHCGFPALGVEGAAYATVASRACSLLLLLWILFRKGLKLPLPHHLWPPPWDKLRNILRIGLPGAGEMFSYAFSQVVITYFITLLGTHALAARTYVANCVTFTFLFSLAVGQSAAICVGHLIGRHQYQAALLLGEYALRISVKITLALALCMALAANIFMPMLTSHPEILRTCLYLFWVDVLLEIGRAVNILTGRMLSAVGDPLFPLVTSLVVVWTVATLGSYLCGIWLGYGIIGMWGTFLADECLRAAIQWRHWRSRSWMNRGFC